MDLGQFTDDQLSDLQQAKGDPSKLRDDTLQLLHEQAIGTPGKAVEALKSGGDTAADVLGYGSKNTFDLLGNSTRDLIGQGLNAVTGKQIETPAEHTASQSLNSAQSAPGWSTYLQRLGVPEGTKLSDVLQPHTSSPLFNATVDYGNPLTLGPLRGLAKLLSGGRYDGQIFAQPGQGGPMRPEVGGALDPNVRDLAGHIMDAGTDPATYLSLGETAAERVLKDELDTAGKNFGGQFQGRGNMNRTTEDKISNLKQGLTSLTGLLTRPFSNAADYTGTRLYRGAMLPLDQMSVAYGKAPVSDRLMRDNVHGGWGTIAQHMLDKSENLGLQAQGLAGQMDQKELEQDLLNRRTNPQAAPHSDVSFSYSPEGGQPPAPESQGTLIKRQIIPAGPSEQIASAVEPQIMRGGRTEPVATMIEPYIDYGTPKSQVFYTPGAYAGSTAEVSPIERGFQPEGTYVDNVTPPVKATPIRLEMQNQGPVNSTPVRLGMQPAGDIPASPVSLHSVQGRTHSGWVNMDQAMNDARDTASKMVFPMQGKVDPNLRGQYNAIQDKIKEYQELGSLNRLESTKTKSRLYDTVPDTEWGQAVRTKEGNAGRMAMAHGINEGVKSGSTPEIQALGQKLGDVNNEWGQYLNVKDVAQDFANREAKKPYISQVDAMLLGGVSPSYEGALMAKKALQIGRAQGVKTGAGLSLHNLGTSWMAPALDAAFKQGTISTLNRPKGGR